MANSIKFALAAACLALVLCALQLAAAGAVGDMVTSFFDRARVPRCPAPGVEHEYDQPITIKTMNFPKEPCMEFCAARDSSSIVGQEQSSFGPKLFCCCKPKAEASAGAEIAAAAAAGDDEQ